MENENEIKNVLNLHIHCEFKCTFYTNSHKTQLNKTTLASNHRLLRSHPNICTKKKKKKKKPK